MENENSENRIASDLKHWKGIEERTASAFEGLDVTSGNAFLKDKLVFFEGIIGKHKNLSFEEQIALNQVRDLRNQMEAKLYPKDNNLEWLLRRAFRKIVSWVKGMNANKAVASNQQASDVKNRPVVKSSGSKVAESLVRAGFERSVTAAEKGIKDGLRYFEVPLSEALSDREKVDYLLRFTRQKDASYSWDLKAALHFKDAPGEKKEYEFNAVQSQALDADKVYDLLSGKAVRVSDFNGPNDGSQPFPETIWIQLDFNDRYQNGNFRIKEFSDDYTYRVLKETYKNIPFKDKDNPEVANEVWSKLLKGENTPVTIVKDGKDVRYFLQASPETNSVKAFDASMKKVSLRTVLGAKVIPLNSQKTANKPKGKSKGLHSV